MAESGMKALLGWCFFGLGREREVGGLDLDTVTGFVRRWHGQAEGPGELTMKQKMGLLLDAESMIWLHEELWRQPSEALAEWWRLAMRQYNVLTATPVTALYR